MASTRAFPPASYGDRPPVPAPSFEALLAEVVAGGREARGGELIEGILPPIARYFGADQAYLALRLPDGSGWDRGHVWTEHGNSTGTARRGLETPPGSAWTDRRLLAGEAVLANSLDDLPPDAATERACYDAMQLRSVLDVPLRGPGGAVAGCAGLRTRARRADWTRGDAERFQLAMEVALGMAHGGAGAARGDEAELRRMAETMRRVEERLYVALDAAGMGVFDWDVPSDRVWYVSASPAQRAYPRDTHETTTAQWFATSHPDDIPAASAAVARAVAGETDVFTHAVRMRIPHVAPERWIHIRSRGHVLEREPDGRARRIIGIYEDVTDEVRREAQAREREVALEHATRSAALGTLATSLAHELNQPLAALAGFVQAAARLLERGDADPVELRATLRRSAELADKASEIVRRLRRLVQHSPPHLESVDVAALLHSVADLLARDARAARVELRVEPGAPGLRLRADRIQLEQVVVNLARNAIEALAAQEGARGVVRLEARALDGQVELRVRDTGPGVPAEVAARLFEPFFTTKATGTGLGLTISRSIVEAHGGSLRLEAPGTDGACFVVTLPTILPTDDDAS